MSNATGIANSKQPANRFKVPHVYVMLFCILLLVAIGTYLIPAGAYKRVKDPTSGKTVVDPASYQQVKQAPVSVLKLFESIPAGIEAAVDVMFLVVLVSASFEIIKATGAFTAGIYHLMNMLKGKELLLLTGATLLFSCVGAFLGWAEGLLVFIPLGVSLAKAIGADPLVGVGMVILGGQAGFTSGVLNIYTTGIGQAVCGLPLFSGIEFRVVAMLIFTGLAVFMLTQYTKKIKKDPRASLVYGMESGVSNDAKVDEAPAFTTRHKLVLLVVLVGFIVVTYGAVKGGMTLKDRTAVFLIIGVVGGILGGLNPDKMANEFASGARIIIPSALTIGIARSVIIIMERGSIIDPIIRFLASGLKWIPNVFVAVGIVFVQAILDFFVTSASGKAVTTMPIIAPLCDMMGITRQVAVLAYQFGDGFTNAFWPTSGMLMAALALGGGIPWEKWAKWTIGLMAAWYVVSCALVVVATAVKLGPF